MRVNCCRISHDAAAARAELDYDRVAQQRRARSTPVGNHFEKAIHYMKMLDKQRLTKPGSKSRAEDPGHPRKKRR